jgi:hypothetical protein
MKKILSLFQRNYETDRLVRNEIVPGSEWVVAGEGVATRKFDGTCCLVRDGKLFKRYDAKQGKLPPSGFEPAQPEPDPVTKHWPGWLAVGDGPDDRWHREAWTGATLPEGTYELIGLIVNGNNEKMAGHALIRHGSQELPDAPRDYEGLKAYLLARDIEGIVWHHPDGRMVKVKTKDFVKSGHPRSGHTGKGK